MFSIGMVIHFFFPILSLSNFFYPSFFPPSLSLSVKTISVPFSFLFVHVMVNHAAFHGRWRTAPDNERNL